MKELCHYAVWDVKTESLLVSGIKYKERKSLHYEESFRGLCTRFKKVDAYQRYVRIKGRLVSIAYWFNVPKDSPCRTLYEAGAVLDLR